MAQNHPQNKAAVTRRLLRYVHADDRSEPPVVKVSVEPESEEHVELILHPDHGDPYLFEPGTCLVVLSRTASRLGVEVEPRHRNGSVAATVNIEPLLQGNAPAAMPSARTRAPAQAEDLQILGHLAGIGDVYVRGKEWLAGPSAPSRIEGISLAWGNKPSGLDIAYSVKAAQPLPISGRMVGLGTFAGTRGRALALTGMVLELSGEEASNYRFAVEALFLGSPVMRVTGQRIVLSGPTGREPLVGLRVSLEETSNGEQETDRQARAKPVGAPTGPARPSGRVRVFRGRPKRNATT